MQALVIKKIGDRLTEEIFPEPKPQRPSDDERAAAGPVGAEGPDAEIVLHDEDGRLLGTAQLVGDVGVYVIGDGYGTTQAELLQCLREGGAQFRVMTDRGRITAIIYLPDPNRPARTGQALRADDV